MSLVDEREMGGVECFCDVSPTPPGVELSLVYVVQPIKLQVSIFVEDLKLVTYFHFVWKYFSRCR